MAILFFWLMLAFMLLGVPVAIAMLFGTAVSLIINGQEQFLSMLVRRLYNGIDNFPLMAVPFFMLAGEVMNRSGITVSLVTVSKAFVGHLRGGLAQINILSSILFAGLSGSAVADCSTLGKMLIPAMVENGYSRGFAAAVTAASSVIGPIIPPSGIMILYAFVMNVSVGGMFAAGIIPGLMVGVGLMLMTWFLSRKYGFPVASQKADISQKTQAIQKAFWPLLTPVILLGGILSGIFTPTEASAIAVVYATIISFALKTLKIKDIPEILYETAKGASVVLFLVGSAVAFSAIVSLSGTPKLIAQAVVSLTQNPLYLLLLLNIILLVVGMFLDAGPAILILGPIFGPILVAQGIDPLHFAVVMCVNLTVGLVTPPMGLVLFVAASVSGEKTERIAWQMLPYLGIHLSVIVCITLFPAMTLTIPRYLGFAN